LAGDGTVGKHSGGTWAWDERLLNGVLLSNQGNENPDISTLTIWRLSFCVCEQKARFAGERSSVRMKSSVLQLLEQISGCYRRPK
jgi:hypothetical protein